MGAEYAITPRFGLLGEWMTMDRGSFLAGLSHQITSNLLLIGCWEHLNETDDSRFRVGLSYTIGPPWRGDGRRSK